MQAILDGDVDGADSAVNEAFDPDGVYNVSTFEELGLMTRNHGLVVRMDDGSEIR